MELVENYNLGSIIDSSYTEIRSISRIIDIAKNSLVRYILGRKRGTLEKLKYISLSKTILNSREFEDITH